MNTAANMQVIDLEQFRAKIKQGGKAYATGERALSMKELEEKVNVSRSSINRWIKAGKFPAGQKFGSRTVRWRESVIDQWMKAEQEKNNEH